VKLEGRDAIVSGVGRGLGEEIAKQLVAAGASVFICARTADELIKTRERVKAGGRDGQIVEAMRCDVGDPAQANALVESALERFPRIDILVNNAGIYGPFGLIEEVDWKEWTDAIRINLFAVVYLCRAVLPHMRKNKYGKIINLSGGGATSPLPRISAYAVAKAAVVRFTETLALEAQSDNIDVNAIAPGALATQMTDGLLAADPEKVGVEFHERIKKINEEGGTPLSTGAALCVYLASPESDGITGKLISAVWDPWQDFQKYKQDLLDNDIYTLRRILPAERGKLWGR